MFTTTTAADLGTATLGSLRVTGTGVVFNDSTVIAHTINSVTTGQVNASTTNPEGVAMASIRSAAIGVNRGVVRLNAAALASNTAIAAYLKLKGLTLGHVRDQRCLMRISGPATRGRVYTNVQTESRHT